MLLAPTSAATFSNALLIFTSISERSHLGSTNVRPFSPVSRRRCSSASVRSLPPARTPQGARASPIQIKRIYGENAYNQVHTFRSRHRNDFSFERPVQDAPFPLVDYEWSLSVISSILVRFCDDPCRSIGYPLINR